MVRKTDKAAFKGVEDRVVSYKTPEGLVKVIHINPDTPVDGSQDSIRYHVLDFYLDNNKDSRKYEQREWNHLIDSGLYDKIFELKERQEIGRASCRERV